jgi:Aminoglycoside/hydroxyurea antibiotic resistance kinase
LRRLAVLAEAAKVERQRLLHWIFAWMGLSAAWSLGDNDPSATLVCALRNWPPLSWIGDPHPRSPMRILAANVEV